MAGSENEKTWRGEYPVSKEEFPFWSPRIQKAYEIGKKAHEGQTRKTTGEPYFNHCVEVAGIIEAWVSVNQSRFVEDLICAALLHDTVEDTDLTLEQIMEEFGGEVAFLVDGVSKFKSEGAKRSDRETIKKVLEGYFVDPRVVILKLADRIQNMQSLGKMLEQKREPKAWETEEVYARLAGALGMWEVMRDLKDAAFPFRYPTNFQKVKEIIDLDPRREKSTINGWCQMIEQIVQGSGLDASVGYRLAGYRQIDQKRKRLMRTRGEQGYQDVSEVLSIGITVRTVEECYRVLGILRSSLGYRLDPGKAIDNIAYPAANGYRSLKEVADFGLGVVEIVIMTKRMEEFNNWGVISLIRDNREDLAEYRMKIIFTPDGEIRALPVAATGWDAAAAINPELVLNLVKIEVNGVSVNPNFPVPHAAELKVIAERNMGRYQTDSGWQTAASPETKRLLLAGIREKEYQKIVEKGTRMAASFLAKRGVLSFNDIRDEIVSKLSLLGCKNIGELLFGIGSGEIDNLRLDMVLDQGELPVNKQTLGLSTAMVRGRDQVGVLHALAGVITELGGNIVRVANRDIDGNFEIRIVIRGFDVNCEENLRERLKADSRYSEVVVV